MVRDGALYTTGSGQPGRRPARSTASRAIFTIEHIIRCPAGFRSTIRHPTRRARSPHRRLLVLDRTTPAC